MNNQKPIPDNNSTPPPVPDNQPTQATSGIGDDAGVRMLIPVGRDPLAIVAGYLGLFSLIVFPAPLALIVSILSILRIRKSKNSPKPLHGMGRAIFGLIMGVIGTVILSYGIVSHYVN